MKKSEFLKLWTREAANMPGIPVETVSLTREPILRKPIAREQVTDRKAV